MSDVTTGGANEHGIPFSDALTLNKAACATLIAHLGKNYTTNQPVIAVQMTEAFSVGTKHGLATGVAGDYLIRRTTGEFDAYPRGLFEQNHRPFRKAKAPVEVDKS